MALQVTPQDAPCGAVVRGVNLSQPLDAATAQAVRAAWLQHQVLAFVDQAMTVFGAVVKGLVYGGTDLDALRTIAAELDVEERAVLARVYAGTYIGIDAAEASQLNATFGDRLADRGQLALPQRQHLATGARREPPALQCAEYRSSKLIFDTSFN